MSKSRSRFLIILMAVALAFILTALTQAAAHWSPPFRGEVVCVPLSPIVREERLTGALNNLPPMEDGDILITDCAHSFGWRHGHTAMLVNAAEGKTVEAVTVSVPSAINHVERWRLYPTFTVLRLKGVSEEERAKIARWMEETLINVPYRLTSGLRGEKAPTELTGSQCAYLVWYAYQSFGYDLDSDGGRLVTVNDLLNSPLLEVVAEVGEFSS